MSAILDAIAPVFLVILAGVLIERAGMLARETGRIVSVLVVNVTLPCLLFNLMTQVTVEQLSRGWWWFATAFLPLVILWSWAGVELLRKVPFGPAVIFGFSTVFFNAAFVGLPVVMNLFPGNQQAMTVAGLCVVASNSAGLTGQICLDAWNRHRKAGSGNAAQIPPQGGYASACWRLFRQYVL
ncbi:MAG: AEC family transporter, partial [Desulfovibrio sp.]|nr:AEC family transporter [Desulfovibrio sp.]